MKYYVTHIHVAKYNQDSFSMGLKLNYDKSIKPFPLYYKFLVLYGVLGHVVYVF